MALLLILHLGQVLLRQQVPPPILLPRGYHLPVLHLLREFDLNGPRSHSLIQPIHFLTELVLGGFLFLPHTLLPTQLAPLRVSIHSLVPVLGLI